MEWIFNILTGVLLFFGRSLAYRSRTRIVHSWDTEWGPNGRGPTDRGPTGEIEGVRYCVNQLKCMDEINVCMVWVYLPPA